MKRSRWIAAAWVAGLTVPAMLATLFVVGCCILPFHGLLHKVMPLCEIASHVMRGHDDHDHHRDDGPVPVPQKQDPVKQIVKFLRPLPTQPITANLTAESPAATPAAYRSFITLGAIRCDDDVGTRLARLDTLRI